MIVQFSIAKISRYARNVAHQGFHKMSERLVISDLQRVSQCCRKVDNAAMGAI